MLTLEQIIDLQGKGFTYEQLQVLNAMDMSTPENPPAPEPKEPEPKEPEPKNPPAPEPKEPEPENDRVKALEDEIEKLTDTIKAMQSANVKSAQAEPKKPETVEDIIQSFMVAS